MAPIRRAGPDDVEALLALGREMVGEVHFGAWSERKVREMIEACLAGGVVFVSVAEDGSLTGTVGLIAEQPWWSEDWQLADRWVFVRPEFRRTGHARALLRTARLFARDVGLPLLMAHVGQRARGKMRLFQREFGDPMGAIFFVPVGG